MLCGTVRYARSAKRPCLKTDSGENMQCTDTEFNNLLSMTTTLLSGESKEISLASSASMKELRIAIG